MLPEAIFRQANTFLLEEVIHQEVILHREEVSWVSAEAKTPPGIFTADGAVGIEKLITLPIKKATHREEIEVDVGRAVPGVHANRNRTSVIHMKIS